MVIPAPADITERFPTGASAIRTRYAKMLSVYRRAGAKTIALFKEIQNAFAFSARAGQHPSSRSLP